MRRSFESVPDVEAFLASNGFAKEGADFVARTESGHVRTWLTSALVSDVSAFSAFYAEHSGDVFKGMA